MKAIVNKTFSITMNDGSDCNFIEGNSYQYTQRGENVLLMDENKKGVIYPIKDFDVDFYIDK